jgi:thiamine biosynthesis lipoprotein
LVKDAIGIFHEVDETCTRFDADSPLMRANASPHRWHHVPTTLFRAVEEAKRAHDVTGGCFDPRVLRTLVALGYDRTLAFDRGDVRVDGGFNDIQRLRRGPWQPRMRYASHEIMLGEEPIDLGGIGKGLAVRWSSAILKRVTPNFLVEAGGDCYCAGHAEDGKAWRIGVEDPESPSTPVCVLAISDRAVTTSSIRLRRWTVDGKQVHHLIDPNTGRPGGENLISVTVVGEEPARAEVWSKALFIGGRAKIAESARRRSIAALWIDDGGTLSMSPALDRYVLWTRT